MDPGHEARALGGVRVLDLSDELAAYASRLLSDLGADVVRLEPPAGASTRRRAPIVTDPETGAPISTFEEFVNAGKRSVTLDLAAGDAAEVFLELVRTSDILIESQDLELERLGFPHHRLREANPRLIHIQVTPFGRDHLPPWRRSDDLIVMAEGGLLHLGGYPDVGPVVAYGAQSRFAASTFAAAAALTALIARDVSGEGCLVDVSAQECVAQALEDSAATYALTGRVRERQGERPREAGTGVYACSDGYVSMVAGRLGTARAWAALVAWLNEEGVDGASDLLDEPWSDFHHRQQEDAIEEFGRIFQRFSMRRTKMELYTEAQRRMIALSPVSTIEDILDNEQLRFRGFFSEVPGASGLPSTFPGPPYRMSLTNPTAPSRAPALGDHTAEILVDELGLPREEYVSMLERGEA